MQSVTCTPKRHSLFLVFSATNMLQWVTVSVRRLTPVGASVGWIPGTGIALCAHLWFWLLLPNCLPESWRRWPHQLWDSGNEDFVTKTSECLGEAVASGCPCPACERVPGALGWNQVSWSLCRFVDPSPSWPPWAFLCVHPVQVLHQVLAVAGLPRVPEEHDVRSEVQALQVMGGAGQRGADSVLLL